MNTSYDKWGNLEPTTIYLAKPGKRLIGAVPGINEDSCSYEKNLNNTSVLQFEVYRDLDGKINPMYEYIQQHYELVMPGKGWFKINEEPEISSDGSVETKSVRAESLEIELQQYDVANFYINTGGVMSKEMLATDNTYVTDGSKSYSSYEIYNLNSADLNTIKTVGIYIAQNAAATNSCLHMPDGHPDDGCKLIVDKIGGSNNVQQTVVFQNLDQTTYTRYIYTASISEWVKLPAASKDGYNMFRDQVLFYRDVTDLEELRDVFMGTTPSDLQGYLYDHPDILQCWRIDFNYEVLDADLQATADEYRSDGKISMANQLEAAKGKVKKGTPAKKEQVLLLCSNFPFLLKHIHITVELHDDPDDTTSYLNDMYEVIDKQIARMRELSLMHLLLDEHGWKVGKIGGVRKRTFSDYVYVNIETALGSSTTTNEYSKLCNSVGQFEIETQDIYSLITQELSSYFECLFEFDTDHYLVNAYKIDDVGLDTNIYLSFHNIQNSVTRGSDKQIYTVFNVQGGNDLYPDEANFGESWIQNIDYFLTTDHFTQEFIDKYNAWKSYRESCRQDYMTASINRRIAQQKADEIYDRVPVDMADTHQYSTMSDNELVEEYNRYLALLAGYEGLYVDEDGVFQPETIMKVQSPSDYSDYYMIKNQILPNIQIELDNRQVASGDDTRDFLDGWEYDFATYGDSYGVGELKTSMTTLQNSIKTLQDKGYDVYPSDGDVYKIAQYELYCKYRTALTMCTRVYDIRCEQWYAQVDEVNKYLSEMNDIKKDVDIENGQFGFTAQELWLLDKYRIWTDYTNENIATTSNSTPNEYVQKAYELIQDAEKELSAESQPQWTFQTTQDNLLLMPEFQGWHKQLEVGNFVRVAMREDYQVKLRVITISFNPFLIEPTIDLTFSNMVQYASKRDDFVSLLENGRSSSKNQISASISSNVKAADINVDTAFILKLINNGTFSSYMGSYGTDAAAGAIGAVSGQIPGIVADQISAAEINVTHIVGETAEFNELFSQYIDSDYVVTRVLQADQADISELSAEIIRVGTDSITEITGDYISTAQINVSQLTGDLGEFAELVAGSISADTIATTLLNASSANINNLAAVMITADNMKAGMAQIDVLEAGSVFADSAFVRSLQSISSTSAQSVITDAYIYNAVAGKISVADLAAGNIVLTDNMKILSDNGMMVMDGTALQIIGEDSQGNEYVGIQLGYDAQSQPSLILRNEDGSTVLTPSGITENAIADQLIKNNMVLDGTLTKSKLAFNVMEEGDSITIEQIYVGDKQFGAEWTTFTSGTNQALTDLSDALEDSATYDLFIESPDGVNVRGGNIRLIAHLLRNSVEVTDNYPSSCFIWTRHSSDSTADTAWNQAHSTGVKQITLSGSDVNNSTNFACHFTYNTDQS